jgi:hypothetical protein
MNRKELAAKVIEVLQPYGYAYGGYVRDLVAGEDFNDIDIFLPKYDRRYKTYYRRNRAFSAVLDALTLAGLKPKAKSVPKTDYTWHDKKTGIMLFKQDLVITDEESGASIDVDIVCSSGTCIGEDHPYPQLDVDINSLTIGRQGEIEAIAGQDTAKVKDAIKRREFHVIEGSMMLGSRITKLIKKGYKIRIDEEIALKDCQPGDVIEWYSTYHGRQIRMTVLHQITSDGWAGYTLLAGDHGLWSMKSVLSTPEGQKAASEFGFDHDKQAYYYVDGKTTVRVVDKRTKASGKSVKIPPEPVSKIPPEPVSKTKQGISRSSLKVGDRVEFIAKNGIHHTGTFVRLGGYKGESAYIVSEKRQPQYWGDIGTIHQDIANAGLDPTAYTHWWLLNDQDTITKIESPKVPNDRIHAGDRIKVRVYNRIIPAVALINGGYGVAVSEKYRSLIYEVRLTDVKGTACLAEAWMKDLGVLDGHLYWNLGTDDVIVECIPNEMVQASSQQELLSNPPVHAPVEDENILPPKEEEAPKEQGSSLTPLLLTGATLFGAWLSKATTPTVEARIATENDTNTATEELDSEQEAGL